MIDRAWFEQCILPRVFQLSLRKPLLSLLLVSFHDSLLLFSEDASFLTLELFHTLIVRPRPLEVSLAWVSKLLPLRFKLAPLRLL